MGSGDPHGPKLKLPVLLQVPVGEDSTSDSVGGFNNGHLVAGIFQQLGSYDYFNNYF